MATLLLRASTVMLLLGLGLATVMATTTTATFSSPAAAAAALALQCRADYTAVALLSCQETLPQSPTASCCDALLYALDIWPGSLEEGQGLCCLCTYMVEVQPAFNLPAAYISCHGQDATAVMAWLQATTPTLPQDCSDVCRPRSAPALPPPPPPSPRSPGAGGSGRGGGGGGRKRQRQRRHHHADFGAGIIIGIVLLSLIGLGLLGWCLYYTYFRVKAKLRRSPEPSPRGSSSSASSDRSGVELGRVSSARRSTSVLLPPTA